MNLRLNQGCVGCCSGVNIILTFGDGGDGGGVCRNCQTRKLGVGKVKSAEDAARREREAAERTRVTVLLPPIAQKAIGTLLLRLPANSKPKVETAHIDGVSPYVFFVLRPDHPCASIARIADPQIDVSDPKDPEAPHAWTIRLPLGEGVAARMLDALDAPEQTPAAIDTSPALPVEPAKPVKRSRRRAA